MEIGAKSTRYFSIIWATPGFEYLSFISSRTQTCRNGKKEFSFDGFAECSEPFRTGCAKGIWSHEVSKMLPGAEQGGAAKFKEETWCHEARNTACIYHFYMHEYISSFFSLSHQTDHCINRRDIRTGGAAPDKLLFSLTVLLPECPTLTGIDLEKDIQRCATMAWI